MTRHKLHDLLLRRLGEKRRFLQVLAGPRQTGKTTLARQVMEAIQKYAHGQVRQRGSSAKLQVLNTALMTAQSGRSAAEARQDGDYWGRLVESCVGAHLLNTSMGSDIEVTYWRDRNLEADFVLRRGKAAVGIEVKSGRRRESLLGMEAFAQRFKPKRKLLVGGQGIPLEEFLLQPAGYWLQ